MSTKSLKCLLGCRPFLGRLALNSAMNSLLILDIFESAMKTSLNKAAQCAVDITIAWDRNATNRAATMQFSDWTSRQVGSWQENAAKHMMLISKNACTREHPKLYRHAFQPSCWDRSTLMLGSKKHSCCVQIHNFHYTTKLKKNLFFVSCFCCKKA